jgi:thymidylate synthase (FAD)
LINVLDKGYIKLVNNMGTDLDVVNSARVSFDKEVNELSEKDSSLISFLVREKHDACFRHCVMTFEVYAPLMVARQWYKHAVASTHLDDQLGWNESSRRYITEKEEFYIPGIESWRSSPDNKKQGSGDSLGMYMGNKYHQILTRTVTEAHKYYLEALEDGVAPEQARLLLPAYAMYVRWRWTVSLNGVMNFLNLRLDPHAQWEIQQYAKAVEQYVKEFYPVTYEAWVKHRSI